MRFMSSMLPIPHRVSNAANRVIIHTTQISESAIRTVFSRTIQICKCLLGDRLVSLFLNLFTKI